MVEGRVEQCYYCVPDNTKDCFNATNYKVMNCPAEANYACATIFSNVGRGIRGCTPRRGCPVVAAQEVNCCGANLCNNLTYITADSYGASFAAQELSYQQKPNPCSLAARQDLFIFLIVYLASFICMVLVLNCILQRKMSKGSYNAVNTA